MTEGSADINEAPNFVRDPKYWHLTSLRSIKTLNLSESPTDLTVATLLARNEVEAHQQP
jgi:hypothetical protein